MEFWYDAAAAETAVRFFAQHLRFTKGEWAGRPFVLQPWQADRIIRPLYGWKRRDADDPGQCTRRYRRCVIFVARKQGKTEIGGGIGVLGVAADGEPGADVYSIAGHKAQASIVFDAAQQMIGFSPTLRPHFELFKTAIYCPAYNSRFMPLTGKAVGKHGLNPYYILGDEVHEWATPDLYQWVRQGAAARRQPLEVLISTAGEARGFGYELYSEAKQIADGIIDDPESLVVIYEAGPDDDIQDPATWAKANPNLGISVKHDYLAREAKRARDLPRFENDFKRYHLNIWTEQAVRWLPMDLWTGRAPEPDNKQRWKTFEARLRGRPCWGGGDLAATRDLMALVWIFPPAGDDPHWVVLPRFWLPEEQAELLKRSSRVPFTDWAASGALTLTPGDVADHGAFEAQVIEDCRRFDVKGLGLDKWNAVTVAQRLQDQDIPVHFVPQTLALLSTPSKDLERMVIRGELDHGHHPVLKWNAANVAVKPDRNDNIRPLKDKSAGKIDGIVALVTALAVKANVPVPQRSYLESSPLLVLG